MTDLREKLTAIVESGKQAEIALGKLETLEAAESKEASLGDIKAATAIAEGEADFETACRLKDRWIELLKRGAR